MNARADGNFAMDTYLNGVTTATSIEANTEAGWHAGGRGFSPPAARRCAEDVDDGYSKSRALELRDTQPVSGCRDVDEWRYADPHDNAEIWFRTVEVRANDGLYINGTKIRMRLRPARVLPTTGRSVDQDVEAVDLEAFKYMNANAVRSSHYPRIKAG